MSIWEQILVFLKNFTEVSWGSKCKYGGLSLLSPKLRITELSNLSSEITEVSVLFTDGWQHWIYIWYMHVYGQRPYIRETMHSALNL